MSRARYASTGELARIEAAEMSVSASSRALAEAHVRRCARAESWPPGDIETVLEALGLANVD